jgi:hypothetical protein
LRGEPVRVVFFGGSCLAGNGLESIHEPASEQRKVPDDSIRFSQQFERWLDRTFPVTEDAAKANYEREASNFLKHNGVPFSRCSTDSCTPNQHRVINKAQGGTDICLLARTIKSRLAPGGDMTHSPDDESSPGSAAQTLMGTLESADLVMLEYAQNDNEPMYRKRMSGTVMHEIKREIGQEWHHWNSGVLELNSRHGGTNFSSILQSNAYACTESVAQYLLGAKPSLPVVFLDYAAEDSLRFIGGAFPHQLVADRLGLPIIDFHRAMYDNLGEVQPINGEVALNQSSTEVEICRCDVPWGYNASHRPPHQDGCREVFGNPKCTDDGRVRGNRATIDSRLRMSYHAADATYSAMTLDGMHPSPVGHRLVAGVLVHHLLRELHAMEQDSSEPTTPVSKDPHARLALSEEQRAIFDQQWPAVQKKVTELHSRSLLMNAFTQNGGIGIFDISGETDRRGRSEWYAVEHGTASSLSDCFKFMDELEARRPKKWGYVCDRPGAGEHITFSLDYAKFLQKYDPEPELPSGGYAWEIGFLSSYEGMGVFDCQVICTDGAVVEKNETVTIDGQWEQHISVYTTKLLVAVPSPAGKCTITVVSQAQKDGRSGNKIKIQSIGVSKLRSGPCKTQGNHNGELGFSLCF